MSRKKILLADDDAEDRSIIQDAMESLGAADIILFANNGEHALEILEKNFDGLGVPCLIVLDLNMPKMNGTKTLGRLKNDARYKHIPVIIYSTSINYLEKEACLLLGAHSYITKPISFKESMETAKKLLALCESDGLA
jgi:CheY-like chemotaxis protein